MERSLRIVIPGGSGQIGTLLASGLQAAGHHVTVLTRSPYSAPWQTMHWDGQTSGPWIETLNGADLCINLTGRSINCRFTSENRRQLYDSRIDSTRLLGEVIGSLTNPPRLWINASAVSIYPHATDRLLDEDEAENGIVQRIPAFGLFLRPVPSSWSFLAQLVHDWEDALFAAPTPHTRRIALRSSIVLSPQPGTAFGVLSRLVQFGLGGTAGSGRQYLAWMHEQDYLRAIEFLIDHEELHGPINMTAPEPATNRDFMAALRTAWNRPNGLWAPEWGIKLGCTLMGSESELVLKSRPIIPTRLLDAGFRFNFPSWPDAARDLVRLWRLREK